MTYPIHFREVSIQMASDDNKMSVLLFYSLRKKRRVSQIRSLLRVTSHFGTTGERHLGDKKLINGESGGSKEPSPMTVAEPMYIFKSH